MTAHSLFMNAVRRLAFLSVAAMHLFASTAMAQALTAFPSSPDPTFRPDPRDAGFAQWRGTVAEGSSVTAFWEEAGYWVIVQSALARGHASSREAVRTGLTRCQASLKIPDDAIEALAASSPWDPFEAVTSDAPLVAITVTPRPLLAPRCGSAADRAALLAHGISLGLDSRAMTVDPLLAVVVLDGTDVRPVLAGRVLDRRVSPGVTSPDGLHAIRVYLRFEDLVQPSGREAPLMIAIVTAALVQPVVISIPGPMVSQLRRELLPWRAQRLARATNASPQPVPLPPPSNRTLREAYGSYLSGAYTDASATALARLQAPRRLSRSDVTTASMQLGLTFAAFGDTAAARLALRQAAVSEPCIGLAPSVAEPLRDMLDDVRPPAARCTALPASRLLVGGVLPGGAQMRQGPTRRETGIYFLMIATAGAVGSVLLHERADRLYAQYQRATDRPSELWGRVSTTQLLANGAAAVAWTAWIGSALYAVHEERRFGRRLEEVQQLGRIQEPRVRVGPAPQGLGLSLTFF